MPRLAVRWAMREDPRVAVTSRLLDAVARAMEGDWQAAHLVAQDHEDDDLANWLHGVVHWMEGDLGNARYWFGRCGRPLRLEKGTQRELEELRAALSSRHIH
jgi:hypothetical protein